MCLIPVGQIDVPMDECRWTTQNAKESISVCIIVESYKTLMSNEIPIVVYLDLDGTIIGDITPQVTEWEILARFCPKQLKTFKDNLKSDLVVGGILRTNFARMITAIKSVYPNVEFFIYTASDGTWANTIIPCVEAAADVTINRPILSRRNCIQNTLEKSLRLVAPIVYKRLKTKYPALTHAEQIYNNSFLIDNTDVLIEGEEQRCLQCPTFNGIYWTDLLRNMPMDHLKRHYMEISIMLRSVEAFPKISSKEHLSFENFRTMYYDTLISNIKKHIRDRKNHKNDNLWPMVAKLLVSARLDKGLSDSTCKYMKKKLASLMHMK